MPSPALEAVEARTLVSTSQAPKGASSGGYAVYLLDILDDSEASLLKAEVSLSL